MAQAKPRLADLQTFYDRDFFAWTQRQAELLRRAAAGEMTSDLDFENLAEEIESLGKRDRRALISQLARVSEHLLKSQYSRAEESRAGWENSVEVHRSKARRILADNPGLEADLPMILSESYEDGRRLAARSVRGKIDPDKLPRTCPYSLDQMLDPDWRPRRP